jgi:hypothetical protein
MRPRKRHIRAVAPCWSSRDDSARRDRPAASRKQVVEGPRAPPFAGVGLVRGRSSTVLFPSGSSTRQPRILHPRLPRSPDERCPSGSGWGKALGIVSQIRLCHAHGCATRKGGAVTGRRRAAKAGRPLTRENSAGDRQRSDGVSASPDSVTAPTVLLWGLWLSYGASATGVARGRSLPGGLPSSSWPSGSARAKPAMQGTVARRRRRKAVPRKRP